MATMGDIQVRGQVTDIRQVMNYVYQLEEQMRYALKHLDSGNIENGSIGAEQLSSAVLEKMKQEAQAAGGVVEDVEYGANVTLRVLVPEKQSAAFAGHIFDQSNGSVTVRVTGESFRAVPLR
jgi:hypothetical protein